MAKELHKYVQKITDPAHDALCDTGLTPGETLTVLNTAMNRIDAMRRDLRETINRQSPASFPRCFHGNHAERCEMCLTGMDDGGIDANGNHIE